MLSYLTNLVLLAALIACTGYMLMVNRRLKLLKSGQDEIGPMIATFARITTDLTGNLENLKAEASRAAHGLEQSIGRAAALQSEIDRSLMSAGLELKMAQRQAAASAETFRDRDMAALDEAFGGGRKMAVRPQPGRHQDVLRPDVVESPPAPVVRPDRIRTAERMPAPLPVTEAADEPRVRRWTPSDAGKSGAISEAINTFYGTPDTPLRVNGGGS